MVGPILVSCALHRDPAALAASCGALHIDLAPYKIPYKAGEQFLTGLSHRNQRSMLDWLKSKDPNAAIVCAKLRMWEALPIQMVADSTKPALGGHLKEISEVIHIWQAWGFHMSLN